MGKSSPDQRNEVRESVTGANKGPLGVPRPFFTSSKSSHGGKSLLKPSYLSSQDSAPSSSSSTSSSTSAALSAAIMSVQQKLSKAGLPPTYNLPTSSSSSSSSIISSLSSTTTKFSKDYSALSAPQVQQYYSNSSSNDSNNYSSSGYQSFSSGFTNEHFNSSSSSSSPSSSMILGSIKRDYNSSISSNNNDDNNSTTRNGGSNFDNNNSNEDSNGSGDRKRKRKSRWQGSSEEKAIIPGMPTILPSTLPEEQKEIYIAQLQVEEITRKLRTGELGIPPTENRSPSPEPIYGADGKRLNTREYRTRKKLEEERHKLIQRLLKLNPDYKPPGDYRQPVVKIVDRVSIPQEEHPEINFVGLLIGPRGNTLKGLEKDTGAKIIIRGKGSVKEGKVGGKAGHPLPGEDEPLHAYVTSNNPDSVKAACEKIKEIIRQGIDMPESQNHLRKNQLLELALLNGTLREGEGPKCSNCGSTTHRTWHCPDKPNVTNSVVCTVCGGAGHIAKDCRMKRPGSNVPSTGTPFNYQEKAKIDEEYMSLMAELGEGPPAKDETSNSGPTKPMIIMRNRPNLSSGNIFDKPSAPRSIAAPPPSSSSSSTTSTITTHKTSTPAPIPPPNLPPPIPPPPQVTSYPPAPPPGMPPMMPPPPSWGYGYPPAPWAPNPPPPPYWSNPAPPPPPPPESAKPPPPPPN